MSRLSAAVLALACTPFALAGDAKDAAPLPPEEAGKHVGEEATFEMVVKASKDRLAQRQEIYLDSTEDHTDPKSLAAVVTVDGAAKFKEAGIDDPAGYFKGKTIRVKGTVTLKNGEPRIEVNDPKQIKVVQK
jgi:DNA/RNA endonuclease YhcR with UshA esterase domain